MYNYNVSSTGSQASKSGSGSSSLWGGICDTACPSLRAAMASEPPCSAICSRAARWAALPQQVMVPAVVLLLQAPLELGVAVGALYAAVTATVAERKQSRRYS